jgi:hypothetical protein
LQKEPRSTFRAAEDGLRASAGDDLPVLYALDLATDRLGWVLSNAGFGSTTDDPPPPSYVRAKALLYMGVLAVRAARAAMAVIVVGYEPEAMTYKRLLLELHSRAQRVADDKSGEYARQWLAGRAGKPASHLRDVPPGMWETLSHSTHADYRAVENFLAVSKSDSTGLVVKPERCAALCNATLATMAGEVRDIAVILAAEHQLSIPDADALTVLIRGALDIYLDRSDKEEGH